VLAASRSGLADRQGCGSAFISSGSGSSILGWIPIRIQYWSGSGSSPNPGLLWPKIEKKFTAEKKKKKFLDQKLQFTYP
jgi:hypothetical protein